jgi:hypothetical protein
MRELFILTAHLMVTLAKRARPGGLGAVAAESLAVKHQLLIMNRAQRRAPNDEASRCFGVGLSIAKSVRKKGHFHDL